MITFKIIKYWFDKLVVYLNTHENKYVASSFSFFSVVISSTNAFVCAYMFSYITYWIHIHMEDFRDDHLTLDRRLLCSSVGKTTPPYPSFAQLPVVLCPGWGFMGFSLLSSLFSSDLGCVAETSWFLGDTALQQSPWLPVKPLVLFEVIIKCHGTCSPFGYLWSDRRIIQYASLIYF